MRNYVMYSYDNRYAMNFSQNEGRYYRSIHISMNNIYLTIFHEIVSYP